MSSALRNGILVAAAGVLAAALGMQLLQAPPGNSRGPGPTQATKETQPATAVELHLKIRDSASGLTLDAKKNVPKGTNGFDALCGIVTVDHKEFSGLGAFVTGLCGVPAPDGYFWAPYIDGKLSDKGVSSVKLERDTLMEWKTEKK